MSARHLRDFCNSKRRNTLITVSQILKLLDMPDEPVTPNMGESHHSSKLTNEQVLSIRRKAKELKASGKTYSGVLAREYDVSTANITDIVNRNTWRHLPEEE
jgi:hypothetical protein